MINIPIWLFVLFIVLSVAGTIFIILFIIDAIRYIKEYKKLL